MQYHAQQRITTYRKKCNFDKQPIPLIASGIILTRFFISEAEDRKTGQHHL